MWIPDSRRTRPKHNSVGSRDSSIKPLHVSGLLIQAPDYLFLVSYKIHPVALDLVVREDPDVRMLDFVADDLAQYEFSVESFLLRERDLLDRFKVFADVWNIPDPSIMLFRNDLDVARRLRMYVEESQEIAVFIHDMRGYLFVYYLAEDAVFHADSLSWQAESHAAGCGQANMPVVKNDPIACRRRGHVRLAN